MNFQCPTPKSRQNFISLSHGGGGQMMNQLIRDHMQALYQNTEYCHHDSSVLTSGNKRLAFTTDSFVIDPIFFPGGDIGTLAVYGTVNDLAMSGARPMYLSLAIIIEEGLELEVLARIISSIKMACHKCAVEIVTGDTKVVEKGKGDKIYINTSGIGFVAHDTSIHPKNIEAGDSIVVSGDLGRHSVAVMSSRLGTQADLEIESDCAPLSAEVEGLIAAGFKIHCLRDLTRGGLASALNELADFSGHDILVDESKIPVHAKVQAYCDILGLDPLYLANEGRFVCVLPEAQAERAAKMIGGVVIGRVVNTEGAGQVVVKNDWGTQRVLANLSGEQLPRIC